LVGNYLIMWTRYHQFESLEHMLRERLRPGGEDLPVQCVVFGGTGAVGGSVVLELARLILASNRYRQPPLRGRIVATGMSDREITGFVRRLYLALEGQVEIEKIRPRREYRIGAQVDLTFRHFHLTAPTDLAAAVAAARHATEGAVDVEAVLGKAFDALPSPFLEFVEKEDFQHLLDGVVVGIPLPSVATYTMESLDAIAEEHGLDHETLNRIKDRYLHSFVRGLAVIRQRHARHVVMAHTTAVGGMYRVDGTVSEIRLGFAHSALGDLLADKKRFADSLTNLYLDHDLEVLITAAAIGIDAVEFRARLPWVRGVRRVLEAAAEKRGGAPVPLAELQDGRIRLYPAITLEAGVLTGKVRGGDPLHFGPGKRLTVEAAIRSGENGLFSVANCMALYNVMKVAIPEELASVIVRRIIFGRERRASWFREGLAYYTQTENAQFAFRVLESDQRLVQAHLGAFAVQSFQALGSSTHQARLHELGLIVLLLRLLDLGRRLGGFSDEELASGVQDLDAFLWSRTRVPSFEDFLGLGVEEQARLLGALCEVRTKFHVGELIGCDLRGQGRRLPGREKFFARLATRIRRYLSTITSLGTPILFVSPRHSEERLKLGPYVAPLDLAVTDAGALRRKLRRMAREAGVPFAQARDWVVVNNGFIDFRPHALATDTRGLPQLPSAGEGRRSALLRTRNPDELVAWLASLPAGCYFTTAGLVALDYRLRQLWRQLKQRRVELGTADTWKKLFFRKENGHFALTPGLVESCRMYSEGLGKVTGTEVLWPRWGY
jgi:hypothetical protein